ncbi:MAG: RNA methyltransferase [Ignavibacteriales bacterium]|nr:RNA methyltransferase [Ignavibacteriales bacterium]
MNIINIESLGQTGLEPYLTLRRPVEHLQQGIFVAEGEKVVHRLLASSLLIRSMLLTHDWYSKLETEGLFEKKQFDIFIADKSVLETIVGFNLHQGIMAVAETPKQNSLDSIVQKLNRPYFFVALDGLVHAENVGVVVRNCAGLGVGAILIGKNSSSPYLRRAVRNSMGSVFALPIYHSTNLRDDLLSLKKDYSVKIISAHLTNSSNINSADFGKDICIILGNEGYGISDNIINISDELISIPMENNTDSLNVSSASAIFLYEVQRQRTQLK